MNQATDVAYNQNYPNAGYYIQSPIVPLLENTTSANPTLQNPSSNPAYSISNANPNQNSARTLTQPLLGGYNIPENFQNSNPNQYQISKNIHTSY